MATTKNETLWDPGALLAPASKETAGYALLVLNQPLPGNTNIIRTVWERASVRFAADGGANRILKAFRGSVLGPLLDSQRLDVIVGDLDSLSRETEEFFVSRGAQIIHDPDQYSTDFTKCVRLLRKNGAHDIVVLGGLGGRVDQGISTLHHLLMFQTGGSDTPRLYLLSEESVTFVLKPGKHRIKVRDENGILAKNIGILPIGEESSITTMGMEWDVTDWVTKMGGQISTSNHVKEGWTEIQTTRSVVFTIELSSDDKQT